jgi:hypothetical protein
MSAEAETITPPTLLAVEQASARDDYRVVLVSADDLMSSVEKSLDEALRKMARGVGMTNVRKSTKASTSPGSSTKTLAGAVDVTSISRAVVDKVSEAALANMLQDPVRQTMADVIKHIHTHSVASHEALVEENIRDLTDAFGKLYRNKLYVDSGSRSRQAMEEENARQRARFLAAEETYAGPEVSSLAGHTAGNASATASRWKKAGRIFSITTSEGERYPSFQFAEGKPRAVIRALLLALRPGMSDWQIAFWFVSANSFLGGDRPVDRLNEANLLIRAAERERELLIT